MGNQILSIGRGGEREVIRILVSGAMLLSWMLTAPFFLGLREGGGEKKVYFFIFEEV